MLSAGGRFLLALAAPGAGTVVGLQGVEIWSATDARLVTQINPAAGVASMRVIENLQATVAS